MKKLKLDLDNLRVDSFDTTPAEGNGGRGTVFGHAESFQYGCTDGASCDSCAGSCGTCEASCCGTCNTCYTNCGTCPCDYSCNGSCYSCGGSCDYSCGGTCDQYDCTARCPA